MLVEFPQLTPILIELPSPEVGHLSAFDGHGAPALMFILTNYLK
jgi:hypothetical protein